MWRGLGILERQSNLCLCYFSHNLETSVPYNKIAEIATDLFSPKYMKEIRSQKQMTQA